jgi:hypothetical protein
MAIHSTYLSAYEDGTECSETSAYKIQTPGNCPEESIQHSGHGENLISRIQALKFNLACILIILLIVSSLDVSAVPFTQDTSQLTRYIQWTRIDKGFCFRTEEGIFSFIIKSTPSQLPPSNFSTGGVGPSVKLFVTN